MDDYNIRQKKYLESGKILYNALNQIIPSKNYINNLHWVYYCLKIEKIIDSIEYEKIYYFLYGRNTSLTNQF